MKHVVILIFQAVKFSDPEVKDLEDSIRNIKFSQNVQLLYLKMNSVPRRNSIDSLSEVLSVKNQLQNQIKVMRGGFDFTNGESLKACLDKYVPYVPGNNYYLISVGHSRGMGFFNLEDDKAPPTRVDISNKNTEPENFNILWNFEMQQALSGIQFKLALFNNCNVTFIDNLLLFSRNIEYMIGTENYQSFRALTTNDVIREVFANLGSDNFSIDACQRIQDVYVVSVLQSIFFNSMGMTNTSLFLIDLSSIKNRNAEKTLNEIASFIDNSFDMIYPLIAGIRNQLDTIGSSMDSIDLIAFLGELKEQMPQEKDLVNNIDNFFQLFNASLVSAYSRKNQPVLNGSSLFFPEIHKPFGDDKYYVGYRQNDPNIPVPAWYRVLDKIARRLN